MTRPAYLLDVATRTFFTLIVIYLLWRDLIGSIVLAVGLNALWEVTAGRKHWREFQNLPKKPRRSWREIGRQLWQRFLSREHTKGLVWAGVVILLLSFVVPLNVYYVVFAVVVFALAVLGRLADPPKTVILPPNEPQNCPADCPPSPPK